MKEADEMQRSLAMRGKDQRPSLILRQEIVECGCYIPIGGAQRHLRFLLACQESAEGRLPVAGRPYLACIVERAGLPLNEEPGPVRRRSEEHTSELQSLMRISYAGFCLK